MGGGLTGFRISGWKGDVARDGSLDASRAITLEHMMQRKYSIGAGALLLVLLGTCLVGYERLKQCEFRLEKAFDVVSPQQFERLGWIEQNAVKEWASLNHTSTSEVLSDRRAHIFEIDDRTCVALLLDPGDLGGNPVYCFNNDGVITGRYDKVE